MYIQLSDFSFADVASFTVIKEARTEQSSAFGRHLNTRGLAGVVQS